MKAYEFLEHTADAKFRAYGTIMEEAFGNAAKAVTSMYVDYNKVKPKTAKLLSVEGKDLKELLLSFLDFFILLVEVDGFFLHDIKDIRITRKKGTYHLNAKITGDTAEHYPSHGSIKAITYNEMQVKKGRGRAELQVVVDI